MQDLWQFDHFECSQSLYLSCVTRLIQIPVHALCSKVDQGDVYRIELPKEKNVYVSLIWPQRKQKCFENKYFLKWSIPPPNLNPRFEMIIRKLGFIKTWVLWFRWLGLTLDIIGSLIVYSSIMIAICMDQTNPASLGLLISYR